LIRQLFPEAKIVGHPGFPESDSRRANNACDEVRPVPNGGPLKRMRISRQAEHPFHGKMNTCFTGR
jgi:hypothetical protein